MFTPIQLLLQTVSFWMDRDARSSISGSGAELLVVQALDDLPSPRCIT